VWGGGAGIVCSHPSLLTHRMSNQQPHHSYALCVVCVHVHRCSSPQVDAKKAVPREEGGSDPSPSPSPTTPGGAPPSAHRPPGDHHHRHPSAAGGGTAGPHGGGAGGHAPSSHRKIFAGGLHYGTGEGACGVCPPCCLLCVWLLRVAPPPPPPQVSLLSILESRTDTAAVHAWLLRQVCDLLLTLLQPSCEGTSGPLARLPPHKSCTTVSGCACHQSTPRPSAWHS
jgi:hypothetical protein